MPGLVIRSFSNAVGGTFYSGGVAYDGTGALLVSGNGIGVANALVGSRSYDSTYLPGCATGAAGFGGGLITTHWTMNTPAPFTHMRVTLFRVSASAMTAGWKASVASSTTIANSAGTLGSPQRPNSDSNWVNVTWNGGNSTAGATPAGVDANTLGYLQSDWMACPSLTPAVDGTNNPNGRSWAMVRVTHPADGQAIDYINADCVGIQANGFYSAGFYNSNDAIADKTLAVTVSSAAQLCILEFRHTVPVLTHCGIGDSITRGVGASVLWKAYHRSACQLASTATKPVQMYNLGYDSTAVASWYERFSNWMRSGLTLPTTVQIPTFSPNDAASIAGADTTTNVIMAISEEAMSRSITPIYVYPTPAGASLTSTSSYAFWNVLRSRAKAIKRLGGIVVETDLGSATYPFSFGSTYSAEASGVHPGDLGHTALANGVSAVLQTL